MKILIFYFLFLFINVSSFALTFHKNESEILKSRTPECREFISKLDKTYSRAWIQVPENIEDPEGHTLNIFYYTKKSTSVQAPWLIFYNGGPGFSSHLSSQQVISALSDFYNLVFIDQRGTGCSDSYPEDQRELSSRFSFYFSRGIVEDSEAIRKALIGTRPWAIFGQSFGAFIVQRYVSMYPHSISLAVGHGWGIQKEAWKMAKQRMVAHDRVLKRYLKTYPKDLGRLEEIYLKTKDLVYKNGSKEVSGRKIFVHLGQWLGHQNLWEWIHNTIQNRLLTSEGAPDKALVKKLAWSSTYFANHKVDIMNILWNRFEAYAPKNSSLSAFYGQLYQEAFQEDLFDRHDWILGEESFEHFAYASEENLWANSISMNNKDPLLPKSILQGIKENPNLKLFLFGGEFDTYAPPESFSEMAAFSSPQINVTIIPKVGHESYLHPQVVNIFKKEVKN